MVAVVSGSGLGLFGSSVTTLGGVGASGSASLGRGTDRVYANSTTGNLVVQSQDERLSALGLDLSLVRTYNSQGLLDDDNGDNWRLGVHQRVHGLAGGALNTAGSTIRKVFGDGREVLYTYNVAQARYISTEGDGAHDTLTNSGGTWTWTDGSGRNTETYNSSGQLTHSRDADGNTVTYAYTGNLLTSIADASGQTTYLDYTGNNLTSIRVVSDGQTQTLTRYYYDSSNRLRQVVLDLSPADNTVSLVDANSDGLYESVNDQMYVTTYTYDGTSRRIASISQGDGSSVSFTYQQVSGQYRVRTYTDAENRTTTLTYSESTGGTGSTQVSANPAALSTTHTENRSLNSGALTSLPGAGTWTAAQLFETTNGAAAGASSLAFDAYGNGFGAWIFSGGVYVRRYDAASAQWSAAVRVDSGTVTSSAVQVAVDRATGKAVLGWIQSTGVAVSSYDLATGTWGAVQLMASSD
ncbi:RHS repeat domain-containing protein, partial [Steroidobacter flavus]